VITDVTQLQDVREASDFFEERSELRELFRYCELLDSLFNENKNTIYVLFFFISNVQYIQ